MKEDVQTLINAINRILADPFVGAKTRCEFYFEDHKWTDGRYVCKLFMKRDNWTTPVVKTIAKEEDVYFYFYIDCLKHFLLAEDSKNETITGGLIETISFKTLVNG